MKKKIAFHTFGCKLNFSETSSILRQFIEKDYHVVDMSEVADIYVINTCTVTDNAEKKCITAIKQAKKRNPDARIAVIGCFSQVNASEIANIGGVDIIMGNVDKFDLQQKIEELGEPHSPEIYNQSINKETKFIPSFSANDRTRSFFKVQDGCDYFCTYCAIPHARGRSRSDTIKNTVETAKAIAAKGIKEIVLTGINLGEFGKNNDENLLMLIKELEKIKNIQRIRISSIEPNLINEKLIEFMSHSQTFLPHFHIPLQSGSNTVLKAMNRKYTRELFADKVEKIRKLIPHCCIACDIIVGFPGETDAHFTETSDFLKQTPISYAHVFSYSERKHTASQHIFPKIPAKTIKERSKSLHLFSEEKKMEFYRQNIGYEARVLWESDTENGFMYGFSDNYLRVKTKFNPILINEINNIHLTIIDSDGIFIWNQE
ncbi:MAG: tRNA (N(6)-L-threonylcarbamoyladenosine(37)-C(2))-methylthiotransferase MtaB [Lentimicrobiaceae bacterium]|nr:tRNA (N(6)-L-threonylcarbamoyladenosine(37)-C(2))-methylthiotransferase MtaB [Lentimicrobiaceae bacterium]